MKQLMATVSLRGENPLQLSRVAQDRLMPIQCGFLFMLNTHDFRFNIINVNCIALELVVTPSPLSLLNMDIFIYILCTQIRGRVIVEQQYDL